MAYQQPEDDPLAYGDDYSSSRGGPAQGGSDRGIITDTFRKLKSRYDQHQAASPSFGYTSSGSGQQPYYGQQPGPNPTSPPANQPAYPGGPLGQQSQQQKPDLATKVFGTLHGTIQSIGSDVAGLLGTPYQPPRPSQSPGPYSTSGAGSSYQQPAQNRFDSFASEKQGNDVKWYVDGCGYFWAVSQALEAARESIWILDWWLSPELYLRRPPSRDEHWRLDRVLQRAAQRGVKVNIIVYKEVTQALSTYFSSPISYC